MIAGININEAIINSFLLFSFFIWWRVLPVWISIPGKSFFNRSLIKKAGAVAIRNETITKEIKWLRNILSIILGNDRFVLIKSSVRLNIKKTIIKTIITIIGIWNLLTNSDWLLQLDKKSSKRLIVPFTQVLSCPSTET